MNIFVCIKSNPRSGVYLGEEYEGHFNPFNDCYQIYKIEDKNIYSFVTKEDFKSHFIRKDIYRNEKLDQLLSEPFEPKKSIVERYGSKEIIREIKIDKILK